MRQTHSGRAALAAALLLFCILIAFTACGKESTEQGLAKLSPEKRAERLLDLSGEQLRAAGSRRIDTVLEMCLDGLGDEVCVIRERESAVGIGTSGYAVHREREISALVSGRESGWTEKSGYRSGTLYLSSDESGASVRLRSPISLSDCLALEAETGVASLGHALALAVLRTELCRNATSLVKTDGSYTVTLSDFTSEALSAVSPLLSPVAELLSEDEIALTGVSATLMITRKLLPSAAQMTFYFSQNSGAPIPVSVSVTYSEIGTALLPDTSEVSGYTELPDLLLLYRVESELARILGADGGAYRYTLSERIENDGRASERSVFELVSYARQGEALSLNVTEEDGTYGYRRNYTNGKCHTLLLDPETDEVLADGTRDIASGEIKAYLSGQADVTGFSPALVSEMDSSRAAEGIYVLRLAAPDPSSYRDLFRDTDGTAADARLTVRLRDGRLEMIVYELHAERESTVLDLSQTTEFLYE